MVLFELKWSDRRGWHLTREGQRSGWQWPGKREALLAARRLAAADQPSRLTIFAQFGDGKRGSVQAIHHYPLVPR